jgi:large repetitive protein
MFASMSRSIRAFTLALLLSALLTAPSAHAEGSPNIGLSEVAQGSVLYGASSTVTLSASSPAGQPYGYNLSYRAVLPEGISYVEGSASSSGVSLAPLTIHNEPEHGQTTLIWANVSDLSPESLNTLSFRVSHSTATYSIGSTYKIASGAYLSSQARYLPKFSVSGLPEGPSASSYTGYATATGATTISALQITQSEASPEGEILRGVHDHQTTYKLTVTNSSVNKTTAVVVEDWLPAALEYLGCGGAGADHTTDAPTNPGSSEEYPGSGAIIVPTVAGCMAPSGVETLSTDPDGSEEDPTGVYTHVSWSLGTMEAGQTRTIEFRAAVPLRENTTTWSGATPTVASGNQAATLDNNSGKETTDGERLTTFAQAAGNYAGTTRVSASEHLSRTAKDITTEKSASSGSLTAGQLTQWTILVHSSEYRYNTAVTVTDTLPNGLCPLSSTNLTASSECEAHGSGEFPSSPYQTATEEINGTWKLVWNKETDAALAEIPENTTDTITYDTRTRTYYQENHARSTPLLADDSVTNTVIAQATANVVCHNDSDCASGGSTTPINHERPLTEAVSDGSSASQAAAGPTIAKAVAESGTECLGDHYVEATPVFHPGDQVCWRLTATFPTTIDTKGLAVNDFLPAANTLDTAFDHGEVQARLGGDTFPAAAFNHSEASSTETGGMITWTLPEEGYVNREGQRFERVYATGATLPHGATPGVLQGNLMKFANVNTPGKSFPYRAEANYALQFPQLTLAKQIVELEGKAVTATSSATVKGGEAAGFALTISNAGELAGSGVEVWDELPAGLTCADIASISNKGVCSSERIVWGEVGLGQEEVIVPASGHTVLSFTVKVPTTLDPSDTLEDHAGVVKYESATNVGGKFIYVPEENIDATLDSEANAVAANAHAGLTTSSLAFNKTNTSAIVEAGNTAAQATIGEQVDFEISATVPAGSTLSGTARLSDPGIPTERLTYTPGGAEVKVNGEPAPGAFKLEEVGGSPVVVFPADYAAPTSGNEKVSLIFGATVTNVSANTRATSIPNTAKLTWTDPLTGAQTREASDSVALVEPLATVTETNNAAGGKLIHGGQLVEFKVKPKNASTASTAFDTKVVELVPNGLSPATSGGKLLEEGESTASGGVWSAKERTITWEVGTLAPNAEITLVYYSVVSESPVATTKLTNKATVTTTSMNGEVTGKRTAANDPVSGKAGYEAKVEPALEIEGSSIVKKSNSVTATIGHRVTYTVEVTLPAHVIAYDETVIDTLPDSLDFDEYVSAECTSGCPPAVSVKTYTPKVTEANTTLAWYLGDLEADSSARTIKLVYRANVRSTHRSGGGAKVLATNTIANSAAVYYDKSHKHGFEEGTIPAAAGFEAKSGPASATSTVVEPAVTLTKEAAVDAGAYSTGPITVTDGDTVHYRLKIANTGGVAAYGVEVKDVLPAQLTAVTATTNSADVTQAWSSGKPELRWKLAEPVAPNSTQTVELGYEAKLAPVVELEPGQEFTNAASISAPYFGVPEAERGEGLKDYAGEAIAYREYTGPTASVKAKVALPTLTIEKTTTASGFPVSANAEVNQSFGWRVVVKNTSTVAAKNVRVSDTLPPNWEYAGGAAFAPGGSLAPTEAGTLEAGRELTWSSSIELAAGASTTLTYQARPTIKAETNPGVGSGHPAINSASVSALDAAGSSEDAKGAFAAGPASAHGVLILPALEVSKTPAKASVAAGEGDSFDVRVHNSGSATAREVLLADTLPKGMSYTAKAASASPSSGFSELSAGPTAVSWAIASIAPGATVEVTVPVGTEASLASGSELKNSVAVSSVEETTPVAASGTIDITTSADVSAEKKLLSKGNAVPGEDITYEVAATDHGPSVAHEVKLIDKLPSGLSYVSSSPECTHSASEVTCAVGTLAPGEKKAFQIVTSLASSLSKAFKNVVVVESATHDPESKNNEASVEVTPHPVADLSLLKKALSPEVNDGEDAVFSLTATNHGPSDAAEAKVIDTLPSGLSYVSARGATCTAKGQEVSCVLGTLTAGAHTTFELTTKASGPGNRVNSAEVTSNAEDPAPANNKSEAAVTVAPAADLLITKTASPTNAKVGDEVTYTLSVTDAGPDTAKAVKVTDALPAGESYQSSEGGCSASGQGLTCVLNDIADGETKTLHVKVLIGAALAEQTVTNTAEVASETFDPETANNRAQAEVQVETAADLQLEKSASPTSVSPGGEATYSLAVTNTGPDPAKGVLLSDELPAGESYLSNDGGCSVSGQKVICELGAMSDGEERTVQIVVRPELALAASTVINTAIVSSATWDPNTANNESRAAVVVAPAADLRLTKTAPGAIVDLPGEVTYTLLVENGGPDTAEGARVIDQLPAGESYLSDDGGCAAIGQQVSCPLGELLNGASRAIHLTAQVSASLGEQEVVNTAQATSETFDPELANNSSSATIQTGPAADMEIETSGPASVSSGAQITWWLKVRDNGPSTAHQVTVEDPLPSGAQLIASSASQGEGCRQAGATLSCDLGTLGDGAEAEIEVTATATLAAGTIENTAHVHAIEPDPFDANNTSSALTTVTALALDPASGAVDADSASAGHTVVRLRKLVNRAHIADGGRLTYRLILSDRGSQPARSLVLCDVIPSQTTVISRGAGHLSAGRICFHLTTLGRGRSRTFKIVLRADSTATGLIVNRAQVSGANFPIARAQAFTRVRRASAAHRENGVTG